MSAPKVQMGGHMQPLGRRQTRTKQDVCDSFLEQLKERGDIDIGAAGFIEGICQHFERLPTRYALDVNIDSLDVLSHKRLLDEARLDPTTVSFAVRSVEVLHSRYRESSDGLPSPAFPEVHFTAAVPAHPVSQARAIRLVPSGSCHQARAIYEWAAELYVFVLQPSPRRGIMQPARRQPLPKPAFGSSPNLQVGGA